MLADYRDNRARRKMLDNRATYMRYELEWIGREGLSPETHEDYLMEFINHFYKNVLRWAKLINERPAVKRGRMVNKITGYLGAQLHERHDESDFIYKTQDKIEV